jgi:hypothetical protein
MHRFTQSPSLSKRQIANRLNVSLRCPDYCLRSLVDRGIVKCANFYEAEDKRRYVYLITLYAILKKVALTGSFLARKMQEHARLFPLSLLEKAQNQVARVQDALIAAAFHFYVLYHSVQLQSMNPDPKARRILTSVIKCHALLRQSQSVMRILKHAH